MLCSSYFIAVKIKYPAQPWKATKVWEEKKRENDTLYNTFSRYLWNTWPLLAMFCHTKAPHDLRSVVILTSLHLYVHSIHPIFSSLPFSCWRYNVWPLWSVPWRLPLVAALCFVSKRQCSAGEWVPCSGKPGAMSASAAPSPGDWPNISWLHFAVFPWYGHITSAHPPVTEPALPTLNILQLSPPFQFSALYEQCLDIFPTASVSWY